ncbi:endonuclease V [Streptomyces aidingensis]|uniref:Endonuclease V n=1 Tax=Streptomyces aidingensis TaxID=910347 RepID=A0A1I1J920_9ACTN|nr:endonuclease V [Streptomyces aidingensis]SFC45109.1 deoxyribonuclease V [Streptomyces aidingensis]
MPPPLRLLVEHTTPRTEDEAVGIQERLRSRVRLDEPGPPPGSPGAAAVAGVDVAYDDAAGRVAAAVVLLDGRTLAVRETATAAGPVAFPYVPGLLAFRELPAVLTALEKLGRVPDLVVCDGYGVAHPRRFGLASHLGVLTGLRTLGVAKNPFVFRHDEPGPARGDSSPLLEQPGRGEVPGAEVGRALRTRAGVKPVFVSAGHRITLDAACAHVLHLAPRYRLPETTRLADRLCREALAAAGAADRAADAGRAAAGPGSR